MDFLLQSNRRAAGDVVPVDEAVVASGHDVVVIGGGDTGSDCVGTSIRQGARSVTQIEILPKPPASRTPQTPWPAHPGPRILGTSSSQEEGCEREWGVLSKEFLKDEDGRVRGVRCVRVDWSSGQMVEVPGSGFELKAGLVLLALGFLHPEHAVLDDLAVRKDDRGHCHSENGFRTSRDRVFVAGDMRRGQSLVVWAILEGRECARQVDEFLTGRRSLLAAKTRALSDLALG